MRAKTILCGAAMLLGPWLVGCSQGQSAASITAGELVERIHSQAATTIIDVRSGWEYRRGHVPGAIHMPFWLTPIRASSIEGPPDQPIVVYCQHGPRAGLARLALHVHGFNKVLYLHGHMAGWTRAGLPVERPERR